MNRDLIESIASLAPQLKVNDTVLVSPGVWWTVVSEDKSPEREMVTSGPAADGILWYGTGLSIWSLLANGLVMVILLIGLIRGRIAVLDRPHRWILINHITVQFLTSCLVVPVLLMVERVETGWKWGGKACRIWIIVRLWLAGASIWSLLCVVFDRFVCVTATAAYARWAVSPTCWRRLTIALIILSCWFTAALALVPTFSAIYKSNFILEQVCAASLSPTNAMFISACSYGVPASLVLIISLAIALARRRQDVSAGKPQPPDLSTDLHHYDVIEDTGNTPKNYATTGTGVSCIEGWCVVLGWLPFYTVGVAAALCSPHTMCVDPGVWFLLSWLGYTTLAVTPMVWLCGDGGLRTEVRRLLVPRACSNSVDDTLGRQMSLERSSAASTVSTQFSTVQRL